MLAQALVYNIGGYAARSEVDKLADPLKKLMFRQAHAKKWFEGALMADNFPSDKVSASDKKVFLQKIVKYDPSPKAIERDGVINVCCSLRGAKGTNLVVRDFWLACRGTNFAYTS